MKAFVRIDCRKLSALLDDAPSLAAAIDLQRVPHFSIFQKAAAQLLVCRRVKWLLDDTVRPATTSRV